MSRKYHDPEWLYEQYHGLERTQKEIAEECGVSPRTIRKFMKQFEIETRELVGENHPQYGTTRSDETRTKISETMQGREFTEKTRRKMTESKTGNEIPDDVRRKISESLTGLTRPDITRKKMSVSTAKDKNPNWIDGRTSESWYGTEFYWAKKQIRRKFDECVNCSEDGSNHYLDVHHIVPIRFFATDDLASATWAHQEGNLILLCRPCHKKAEHGGVDIAPDFQKIPVEYRTTTLRLWFDFTLALMD